MGQSVANLIRGRWDEGSGKTLRSLNPATGEVVWEGRASSQEDVADAVAAAEEILPQWIVTPVERKVEILKHFQHLLENAKDFLADAIGQETGKPLWEAVSEVEAMIQKIPLSIAAYRERCFEVTKEKPFSRSTTRHKPHGVVAILGPYNLPGHLAHGHIIPALLAGNTIVYKPSEKTPLVGMRMMEQWEKTSIPQGVVNLVQGDGAIGEALAQHPAINGIFFTGSYATGRALQEKALARPGVILALEMGGNNPLIVSTVRDTAAALSTVLMSCFLTTGQRCSCARRLFIPKGKRGDLFLDALIASVRSLRIGSYKDDPPPFMGPMIDLESAKRVLNQYETLKGLGGVPLLALEPLKQGLPWISPGLLDMTSVIKQADEEIFGPLVQVIRYGDFSEAVQKADETEYGLAAGLLSDDPKEYALFYQTVRAGVINWNTPLTGASSEAPFGGIGRSGNFHPAGYYSVDYCSYPVASLEAEQPHNHSQDIPGMSLHLPAEYGSKS